MEVLNKFYKVKEDWKGELYCGITLAWNYEKQYVNIVMPNYIKKQLIKYRHPKPKCHQACPFEPNPVYYGKKYDKILPEDESKPLNDENKKYT